MAETAPVTQLSNSPAASLLRAGTGRPGRDIRDGAASDSVTRIALYSHDTLGLGHTRRNMLIAQALAEHGRPCSILLISGALETRTFELPAGVDCLSLPALSKERSGSYRARRLACSLDELIEVRSATIRAATRAFRPHVFIVDNVPHGARGELVPTLLDLRRRGGAHCVLGLRDILDDPDAITAEWRRAGAESLLRTVYDAIWIYGDQRVYDPLQHYDLLAPVAQRARFTGYLDQRLRPASVTPQIRHLIVDLDQHGRQLALCMVGGGQDGAELATSFARAPYPEDMSGVLLAGPFMPEDTRRGLHKIADRRGDLIVLDFVPEPACLIERADRVVSMGGYNTTCEILSYSKTALIVPRVRPRQEQWLRASRLRELGVIDMLHPDLLSPDAVGAWLACTSPCSPAGRQRIDIDGMQRIPELLEEMRASVNARRTRPAARDWSETC